MVAMNVGFNQGAVYEYRILVDAAERCLAY
jgi:hypothetical protein